MIPRIGIDIGGVLTRDGDPSYRGSLDEWDTSWEAPGAFDAVRKIVQVFGAENTFLVSKVRPGGNMQRRMEQWLHETCDFCKVTGVLKGNIVFVRNIDGPEGKGAASCQLGLSHFIDDKLDVLKAVFEDEAGNSRHLVEKHFGILFHFGKGGWDRAPPPCDMRSLAPMMRRCYKAVANWNEVVEELRERLPGSIRRGSGILTPPRRNLIPFRKAGNAQRAIENPPPWRALERLEKTAPTPDPTAEVPPEKGKALVWTGGRPKLNILPKTKAPTETATAAGVVAPPAATTVVTQVAAPAPATTVTTTTQLQASPAPATTIMPTKQLQASPAPATTITPVKQLQVSSPTARRGSSLQPPRSSTITTAASTTTTTATQFEANGRPRLNLKPRDPKLGPVGQPATAQLAPTAPAALKAPTAPTVPAVPAAPAAAAAAAAVNAAPSRPVTATQPPPAVAAPAARMMPTANAAPAVPAAQPASMAAAAVPSASKGNAPALQVDPEGGRPKLVLLKRGEAAATAAAAEQAAVAAAQPAGPAVQKDPVTGRPKLMLKPRTVPK